MRENAKGYFLEKEGMDWFTRLYAPDKDSRHDPRLSPLQAKDLSGLPPAYVITAGFDPLRDEGRDYADALDKAGVSITYVNYPGMVHGFFSMRSLIPKAREAVAAAAAALREGVNPANQLPRIQNALGVKRHFHRAQHIDAGSQPSSASIQGR